MDNTFGRNAFGQRAPAFPPSSAANPQMRAVNRLICRCWAAVMMAGAATALRHGLWLGALLMAGHAGAVWPETIIFAKRRGRDGLRRLIAWASGGPACIVGFAALGSAAASSDAPAVGERPVVSGVLAANLPVRSTPHPPKLATLKEYREKIPGYAVSEIDRAFYPKLYSELGGARVAQANALAPWVALRAALSPRCDQVEYVEMSSDATRKELKWFVDCANRERFYVSEVEAWKIKARFEGKPDSMEVSVASNDIPVSESAKLAAFNEADAIAACERTMKSALQSPTSYKITRPARIMRHQIRGRVTITQDFTARNGLNAPLDSQWACLLDGEAIIELKYLDGGEWRAISQAD